MPDGLLNILMDDVRFTAIDRIRDDIEDIEDTLDSLFDFMIDILAAQALDSHVDSSCLSTAKDTCETNPTVICYLTSIFNQLHVNPSALNIIPESIGNSLLSAEMRSILWQDVDGGGLTFADCLESLFDAIIDSCLFCNCV